MRLASAPHRVLQCRPLEVISITSPGYDNCIDLIYCIIECGNVLCDLGCNNDVKRNHCVRSNEFLRSSQATFLPQAKTKNPLHQIKGATDCAANKLSQPGRRSFPPKFKKKRLPELSTCTNDGVGYWNCLLALPICPAYWTYLTELPTEPTYRHCP